MSLLDIIYDNRNIFFIIIIVIMSAVILYMIKRNINCQKELEDIRNEEIKYFQELKNTAKSPTELYKQLYLPPNVINDIDDKIVKSFKTSIKTLNEYKNSLGYITMSNDLMNKYVETLPLNEIYSINKKIKTNITIK